MSTLAFRTRVTLWSMLVVLVSLVVCGLGAAWFAWRRESVQIDAELRRESAHFFNELENHGGANFDWKTVKEEMAEWLPPRKPPRLMEIRTGAEVRWQSKNPPPPGIAAYGEGFHDVQFGDKGLRLLVEEEDGVTFAIATDVDEAEELARGLALAMLAGLPVALAFAWLGGRRLAALAVRPVEEMTAAMRGITAESLDQRVPEPPAADEIQRHARVLNASLDRLERSYRQALRFSADASHELKTPLTVLRTSIESMLASPSLSETDRDAASELLEQTRRLSSITASLLLLARADGGRLTLDFAEHDVSALIEACAEDARIMAEPHQVQVACSLPERAYARVDAVRFCQIVSNLLDNALKYNQSGGEVRVTLENESNLWKLRIGNTGPVIAPEYQTRLFERFFRAEHGSEGGAGLGLGLARELARAHDGDVRLIRSEDGWTEFVFEFPAIHGQPTSEPREATPSVGTRC